MPGTAILILWSHAIAAVAMAVAAALLWRRGSADRTGSASLAAALVITAGWALAVGAFGDGGSPSRVLETLRDLAWLGTMLLRHRRDHPAREQVAVTIIYSVVGLVAVLSLVLSLFASTQPDAGIAAAFARAAMLMAMMVAVASLVLAHSLYQAGKALPVRILAGAAGAMWLIDLNALAILHFAGQPSGELLVIRGIAMIAVALAVSFARTDGAPSLSLSRTVAVQSLTLTGIAGFCAVLALGTAGLAAIGGSHVRLLQTAFVFGTAATLLACASAPWMRAWVKVKLAKHFFRHRYDYREEWARFSATLGNPDDGIPLDLRVVKAVADLVDSPAGILLIAGDDRLQPAAQWRWRDHMPIDPGAGDALAAHLAATGRIVELDAVRSGSADVADREAVPGELTAMADAWVLVPLVHLNRLVGAILLARPPVARTLDWEDFDLLKLVGRQAASHLEEARAQARLAEAERFDEFNRRFAFILHDIKNLVSQLTLTARNAERHADNPAFRADMVATLTESSTRMTDLLARLSQHPRTRATECLQPVEVQPVAARVAASLRLRHPVAVVTHASAIVAADPGRLEQALAHLVANAVDASPPTEPVTIAIMPMGADVAIEVIDRGCGMDPAFVRDQLWRPFASTKPGGFGIGAYEARELIRAMHGRIEVASREGEGTRFRIVLPAALAPAIGRAA